MAAPTPWTKEERASEIVIHDTEGRVVCSFALYGDEALDAETRANMDLILRVVNGE